MVFSGRRQRLPGRLLRSTAICESPRAEGSRLELRRRLHRCRDPAVERRGQRAADRGGRRNPDIPATQAPNSQRPFEAANPGPVDFLHRTA